MPSDNAIEIEFDEENRCYYIVWQPLIIGLGGTKFDTQKMYERQHILVLIPLLI